MGSIKQIHGCIAYVTKLLLGSCYKAVAGVPIIPKDDKPTLKGEWRMPEFRLLLTNYGELTHCKTIEEQLACFLLVFIALQSY